MPIRLKSFDRNSRKMTITSKTKVIENWMERVVSFKRKLCKNVPVGYTKAKVTL